MCFIYFKNINSINISLHFKCWDLQYVLYLIELNVFFKAPLDQFWKQNETNNKNVTNSSSISKLADALIINFLLNIRPTYYLLV